MDCCWGAVSTSSVPSKKHSEQRRYVGGKASERGRRQPKPHLQCIHKEKGEKQSSGRVLAGKRFGVLNGKVLSPAGRTQWGKGNRALYILCRKIGVHQRNI